MNNEKFFLHTERFISTDFIFRDFPGVGVYKFDMNELIDESKDCYLTLSQIENRIEYLITEERYIGLKDSLDVFVCFNRELFKRIKDRLKLNTKRNVKLVNLLIDEDINEYLKIATDGINYYSTTYEVKQYIDNLFCDSYTLPNKILLIYHILLNIREIDDNVISYNDIIFNESIGYYFWKCIHKDFFDSMFNWKIYKYFVDYYYKINTFRFGQYEDKISQIWSYIVSIMVAVNYSNLSLKELDIFSRYAYISTFYGNKFYTDHRVRVPYYVNEEFLEYEEHRYFIEQHFLRKNIPLDIFSGFLKNEFVLEYLFINNIYNSFIDKRIEKKYIMDFFKTTDVYKNKVFISALYQKYIMDYGTIYNGMEYTTVLVNMLKGIEELIVDIIKKYNIHNIINNNNRISIDERCSFNDSRWEEYTTLGNYNYFISYLNGNKISNKINMTNKYYNKYDSYFKKYLSKEINYIKNNTNISKSKIQKINNGSYFMFVYLGYWIDECRNNRLHKDNVLDKEKVEQIFDNTYKLIGLLIEWSKVMFDE